MGDLIADAQPEATHAAANGGAMIEFTNQGGIRTLVPLASGAPSAEAGKVTYGQLFAAQPFGNC